MNPCRSGNTRPRAIFGENGKRTYCLRMMATPIFSTRMMPLMRHLKVFQCTTGEIQFYKPFFNVLLVIYYNPSHKRCLSMVSNQLYRRKKAKLHFLFCTLINNSIVHNRVSVPLPTQQNSFFYIAKHLFILAYSFAFFVITT